MSIFAKCLSNDKHDLHPTMVHPKLVEILSCSCIDKLAALRLTEFLSSSAKSQKRCRVDTSMLTWSPRGAFELSPHPMVKGLFKGYRGGETLFFCASSKNKSIENAGNITFAIFFFEALFFVTLFIEANFRDLLSTTFAFVVEVCCSIPQPWYSFIQLWYPLSRRQSRRRRVRGIYSRPMKI